MSTKSEKEEVRYPEGEERLILGRQRNEFADFELKLRVENLAKYLKYALEETINLQNMIYWHIDTPDEKDE
jgi:hypothetical protein